MRRTLRPLAALVIHGNLAGTSWLYQGPQAGLDGAREVLAFCERAASPR
jgi:hypothetical protein